MKKAIKRGIALWLAVLFAGLAALYINAPPASAVEQANMIDVSSWQGDINWEQVAASGIDYAIIRVCAGTREDTKWEQNYIGATEAGIQVGVYLYNYATTVEGAAPVAPYAGAWIEISDAATMGYVDAAIAALEERIAALEGNT